MSFLQSNFAGIGYVSAKNWCSKLTFRLEAAYLYAFIGVSSQLIFYVFRAHIFVLFPKRVLIVKVASDLSVFVEMFAGRSNCRLFQ